MKKITKKTTTKIKTIFQIGILFIRNNELTIIIVLINGILKKLKYKHLLYHGIAKTKKYIKIVVINNVRKCNYTFLNG